MFKINSFGLSDVGIIREKNEDVWGRIVGKNFFVLADGMGGHRAGEVAARETVNALCKKIKKYIDSEHQPSTENFAEALKKAIKEVNQKIFQLGSQSEELRGMGTTLCSLYFNQNQVIFSHVGDSRIYRIRGEEILQLTKDHSLFAELIDSGKVEKDQSGNFFYKNIITKAIGTDVNVEPEVHIDTIEHDDFYLVCSDGLTDLLSDEEIGMIIITSASLRNAAERLIAKAKMEGGHDNITVIVLHAEERND